MATTDRIRSIRGMHDVLPDACEARRRVADCLRELCDLYGYREIQPPLVEKAELFERSIGAQTDIVEKEMYTFVDNNGERVTLRPEATASCVRACIEHGLIHNGQAKLWYLGPMFRHERPQKGRYRQFHQFGLEALGWSGPDVDAELMIFAARLWRRLGVGSLELEINMLGSETTRADYRAELVAYLEQHRNVLDDDSLRRLESNPLRILDSKHPETLDLLTAPGSPSLKEHLDDDSSESYKELKHLLDKAGVEYSENPRLVRGLDYYTGVVFEWTTTKLGAQGAVCAGGRYDGLVAQLGGRATPACGFALGLERLLELIALESNPPPRAAPDAYFASTAGQAELEALTIAEALRDRGFRIVANFGAGNLSNQMRRADRSGARVALILGDEEMGRGEIGVKDLRGGAPQVSVPTRELASRLADYCR